ncbi:GNAT family N-acetyltransferase [Kutzneria kofuensis]|uniref:GNAT superfamily N-acetyltransferase n=1 Tax=Kutzneria kofuensis TaxID=103725 RepID=A0A7W9NKR8_9PSEU|nr:GNAT family N-acetyltransferase [Kutzneria kofuensis]MBB5895641.1 GNAT superfamily N-acetyltransferase [Kutzneria kofuensis]
MNVDIRRAVAADVPAIVAMLADDPLGASRENPSDIDAYLAAFDRIDRDSDELLMVADRDGEVVGTLQLSFLHGLSRQGATRAQIEAVRVRADARSEGLGARLIEWAVAESRRRGCHLVQLTSDNSRTGAHRFYEGLGFTGSHVGYKLTLV